MKYYVYRHIRLDKNQPFYIGIGTKPVHYASYEVEYRRAFTTDRRNIHWRRIVEKSDYLVEILYETDCPNECKNKEIEFISLYKRSVDGGTLSNITTGGDGTHGFSRTPEINALIGYKNSGIFNKKSKTCYKYDSNYNLIDSYESFNIASKENNLYKQNLLGAKDSKGIVGGYYWFDFYMSPSELKDYISTKPVLRNSKYVYKYDLDGNFIERYESIKAAQAAHSTKKSQAIKRCMNGYSKTAYGFKWQKDDKYHQYTV